MEINKTVGSLSIRISDKRITAKVKKSQNLLDMQVLGDSNAYAPYLENHLIESSKIVEPGLISWNTPYAHYQYMGELYLTEDGRSFASDGETKYPTGENLVYHQPNTGSHWFETAKAENLKHWIDIARKGMK